MPSLSFLGSSVLIAGQKHIHKRIQALDLIKSTQTLNTVRWNMDWIVRDSLTWQHKLWIGICGGGGGSDKKLIKTQTPGQPRMPHPPMMGVPSAHLSLYPSSFPPYFLLLLVFFISKVVSHLPSKFRLMDQNSKSNGVKETSSASWAHRRHHRHAAPHLPHIHRDTATAAAIKLVNWIPTWPPLDFFIPS